MNNIDQIEATAKHSKALREAATKALRLSDQCAIDFLIESHNAALDEVCLSLAEELRSARTVIRLYRRWEHACEVECATDDECDTSEMAMEASFAAEEYMEKFRNKEIPDV